MADCDEISARVPPDWRDCPGGPCVFADLLSGGGELIRCEFHVNNMHLYSYSVGPAMQHSLGSDSL